MSAPSAASGEASGSEKRSFGALVETLNPGTLNACNLNAFSVQAEGSRAWRPQRSVFTRSQNPYPRRSATGIHTLGGLPLVHGQAIRRGSAGNPDLSQTRAGSGAVCLACGGIPVAAPRPTD